LAHGPGPGPGPMGPRPAAGARSQPWAHGPGSRARPMCQGPLGPCIFTRKYGNHINIYNLANISGCIFLRETFSESPTSKNQRFLYLYENKKNCSAILSNFTASSRRHLCYEVQSSKIIVFACYPQFRSSLRSSIPKQPLPPN